MMLVSTRSAGCRVSSAEAILRGLAPDGGLFIPERIPVFSPEEIYDMKDLPYPLLAGKVISRFLPGFSEEEITSLALDAYASFRDPLTVPLRSIGDGLYVLELFHGPTCAFKDLALQMLPGLIASSVKKTGRGDTVAILTATSGDTGKAALEGFADKAGTKICVFYPHGGVSETQRLQMVTQRGKNVMVFGIRGNFDDAQTGVKNIFSDPEAAAFLKKKGIILSSANSINWGRLAAQTAYYYSAYMQLLRSGSIMPGQKVNFSVPTGNFGDILAGYLAGLSGLPVGDLICASNSNNVLTDFIRTGIYDRNRDFRLTMSPSMDILISSNLERLLYLITEDPEKVSSLMAELSKTGRYDAGTEVTEKMASEGFRAYFANEAETARVIKDTFEGRGYAADPHTAVALSAAFKYMDE